MNTLAAILTQLPSGRTPLPGLALGAAVVLLVAARVGSWRGRHRETLRRGVRMLDHRPMRRLSDRPRPIRSDLSVAG
jgi:predicted nuclease with RNAse H fold